MGITTAILILDKVDDLLKQRRYSDAKRAIGQLSPDEVRSDREILGRYFLTRGKVSVRLSENDISVLDRAIEIFRSQGPVSEFYGQARLWKGLALEQRGDFAPARQQFSAAATWYHHRGDAANEALALNSMAYSVLQLGQFEIACKALQQAIDLYHDIGDKEGERIPGCNLARTYVCYGRIQKGLETFAKYPIASNEIGRAVYVDQHLNMTTAYAQTGRFKEARDLLKRCSRSAHTNPQQGAHHWQERGRLRYWEGNYQAAFDAFKKANMIAGEESDLTCGVVRWLGECCLALGRFRDAAGYAQHSLTLAERRGDRWIIGASKRVLAGVAAQRGDARKARVLFTESIAMFEQIQNEYELAFTCLRAARSGLFSDAQSGEWLSQADEYFEREEMNQIVRN